MENFWQRLKKILGVPLVSSEQLCRTLRPVFLQYGQIIAEQTTAADRALWASLRDVEVETIMGVFKLAIGAKPDGSVGASFSDPDFGKEFNILHEFMTATVDDDNKPRQTATVLFFVEQGVCKACLRERDHALTLWVSSSSILGCFRALEDALNESPVPWRLSSPQGTTRRVKLGT